jgi:WD40 repeat protein
VAFVADDLAAWLIGLLAEAGRRGLTTFVLGTGQERELRSTAAVAVRSTATEFRPDDHEQAEYLAMAVSQVFSDPVQNELAGANVTMLESLHAGIARQLISLGDPNLTGTGKSWAEIQELSLDVLADTLTGHVVREISARASRGGPLTPLAAQLNSDMTHLQGRELEGTLSQLADEVRQALARSDRASSTPKKVNAPPLQVPLVTGWVDRTELAEVVSALTSAGSEAVALTTGLEGAGGFGKTMLAAHACSDPAVRRSLPGGIMWVTLGRDVDGAALASRISEMIMSISGAPTAFTSPEQAGHALARALAGRGRVLLVIDDVWTAAQLEPFTASGAQFRLLVTTRRPVVLEGVEARRIKVDAMPDAVGRRLLTRGLPRIAAELERELLELAGGWPLLLSLINQRLIADVEGGADVEVAAGYAARRLRREGPAALDITDSGRRQTAVSATVDYSLDTLDTAERHRFVELGVFAEDTQIPLAVAALLWHQTAGMSVSASESLCERLDRLSLLTLSWIGDTRVTAIHDVIRDYALSRLGAARQAAHGALISAARTMTRSNGANESADRCDDIEDPTAWWKLPQTADSQYLFEYLTYHLQGAGLDAELDQVCCDLRFLATRLVRSGPAAIEADLARSGSPTATRLRRAVAHNAHLLRPGEPAASLVTIFTSRLGGIPELASQLPVLRSEFHTWTASPTWPLPDLSSDGLVRVIRSHDTEVTAVAISPDGNWLATTGWERSARTWAVDGRPKAILTGHRDLVTAVAISPDGSWVATGSHDGTARTWSADGAARVTLTGHQRWVDAVAISPDGTWLATGSLDSTARIWGIDGTLRATLTGHQDGVDGVAISPDGTWLATASNDGTARTWFPDGTPWLTLTGHRRRVRTVTISPDGTWLATSSDDGTTRIWGTDGTLRATVTAHQGTVTAVAISPDGTWLATSEIDGTVRIWAADGTPRATFTGQYGWLNAVAIAPDGTWLATGGRDGTVQIWAAEGPTRPASPLDSHQGLVKGVAISSDGTWLATAGGDGRARIWAADGTLRSAVGDREVSMNAVAISLDGTWLATVSADGTAQIQYAYGGHDGDLDTFDELDRIIAVAIAPDGSWLATGETDGSTQIWAINEQFPQSNRVFWNAQFSAAGGFPRAMHQLIGHQGWVNAVAISHDGTWLATGSANGAVQLWAFDGALRATLTGLKASVTAVAISPDSTRLATGTDDGTVRIWVTDGMSSSEVAAIRVDGCVWGCAWFPGSSDICVAGQRGLYKFSLQSPQA